MENRIKENIENPEFLERLYREDKKHFERAFFEIYPELSGSPMADFWKARLVFGKQREESTGVLKNEILFLIIACLIAGFLIKLPDIFNFKSESYLFYEKNAGLVVFLGLSVYAFLTKPRFNSKQLIFTMLIFAASAVYINLLPNDTNIHSVSLALLHFPLFLWYLYGLLFADFDLKNKAARIDYLRYNGDIVILANILLLAGVILTAITLGLFSVIGLNIEDFYMEYIATIGLVSSPIVATYIIKILPMVTNKIAPIIAGIFSPLVLITLVIYLISFALMGKDPYNDRDFLIIFNLMLIGVMALILFSVSETSVEKKQRFNELVLFALSIVTLIVDLIALSAILYRLGEYGFTPNRTAVLGLNLLIFGNLILIMIDLFKVGFRGKRIQDVEKTIASYLPVYLVWIAIVTFGFPFIFGMK